MLEQLGVHPGDQIILEKLSDGRLEVRAARSLGSISAAFDFLKRPRHAPNPHLHECSVREQVAFAKSYSAFMLEFTPTADAVVNYANDEI